MCTIHVFRALRQAVAAMLAGALLLVSEAARAAPEADGLFQSGVPKAPSSLVATPRSDGTIKLTWKDNSTNETGFDVSYRLSNGNWASKMPQPAANATSYVVSKVPSGYYEFKVCAFNRAGCSVWSNVARGVLLPLPPANIKVSKLSSSSVKVTWQDVANNEGGYALRLIDPRGKYRDYALPSNSTSTVLKGLGNGKYGIDMSAIPSNAIPSNAIPSNLRYMVTVSNTPQVRFTLP